MLHVCKDEELTIEHPLQIISFVDNVNSLKSMINFVIVKSLEYNRLNEEEDMENFFPVCSYNSRSHIYEIEYDFFVYSFVEWIKMNYNISVSSESFIYDVLTKDISQYGERFRGVFLRNILGDYFKVPSSYYIEKMRTNLIHRLIKNSYEKIAFSSTIQIKKGFVLDSDKYEQKLDYPDIEVLAFGYLKSSSHPAYKLAKKVYSLSLDK